MKRKSQIKRTLVQTKFGPQARYYQDGKRLTEAKGKKKWIAQEYDSLTKKYTQKPELTQAEQRSLKASRAQKELYTYNGKRIRKIITDLLIFNKDLPKDPATREITEIIDPKTGKPAFRTYGQLEQRYERVKDLIQKSFTYHETLAGYKGFRFRNESESIVNLLESLGIVGYDGWKLVVIDQDVPHFGKVKGMEAIRNYENREMDAAAKSSKNLAAMSFTYQVEWDFNTKTLTVNTADALPQQKTSDPIAATPIIEMPEQPPLKKSKPKRKKSKPKRKKSKTKRKK